MNGGGFPFRGDITLGNVISWVVMLMAVGLMYGVLRTNVEANTKNNERQDASITALTTGLSALQITAAEGNSDLRALRETMQRIEKQQNDAWQAQRDQWQQERDRDKRGAGQ